MNEFEKLVQQRNRAKALFTSLQEYPLDPEYNVQVSVIDNPTHKVCLDEEGWAWLCGNLFFFSSSFSVDNPVTDIFAALQQMDNEEGNRQSGVQLSRWIRQSEIEDFDPETSDLEPGDITVTICKTWPANLAHEEVVLKGSYDITNPTLLHMLRKFAQK